MGRVIETGQKGSQMQPNTTQRLAKEWQSSPILDKLFLGMEMCINTL
jgi:hypothetical protein